MDQKQQLINLYEDEMEKIREIKEDIDSLGDMTDEQLFVLVEKAQNFHEILEESWEQVSGNEIKKNDVRVLLLRRNDLIGDFTRIQQLENQIADLENNQDDVKKDIKRCRSIKKKERNRQHSRMVQAISFGVMFLCAVCFHLIMMWKYHTLILPALLIMTILPLILCVYNAIMLKRELDIAYDHDNEEELEWNMDDIAQKLIRKQEQLEFYDRKYQTVFEELDDYQMDAYPYVEQIIHKMEFREDYQRAKNEYCGIIEILHFKQPDIYLYIPEIFLIEEEMDDFLQAIQKKLGELDEYLVQTLETA